MDYEKYMRRALQLAANGLGYVSPNPMVGAVIVEPGGRIIGEGWHRKYGEAHAEVNACLSVNKADWPLMEDSTIFVTLEPCCHHGKTPPCADLLIEKRFRHVVIGATDPFTKVNGGGIRKLQEAGIEVTTGLLGKECRELNRAFFFAHINRRPFVTLKWAQSADGWMDAYHRHPFRFSNNLSQTLVHRLRSLNDAILTTTSTVKADNPRLDVRKWSHARRPAPVILGSSILEGDYNLMQAEPITYPHKRENLKSVLEDLYETHHITSLLVEAGPNLLDQFIEQDLWQEIRVEVNPVVLGSNGKCRAPQGLPAPAECTRIMKNNIYLYKNYQL